MFQARGAAGPHRVDEGVRRLDVAEGGVQRQAEADGVVQTRLQANRSGKNHVSDGTHHKQLGKRKLGQVCMKTQRVVAETIVPDAVSCFNSTLLTGRVHLGKYRYQKKCGKNMAFFEIEKDYQT